MRYREREIARGRMREGKRDYDRERTQVIYNVALMFVGIVKK